jgi:ABC-type Fe3+/spermidine/putrescine transport system ATPase subunit
MNLAEPILEVKAIHKTHDGSPTLTGIDLSLFKGEILCLLGPSGCGKTTLLRIIAGLEKPDRGQVLFDKNDLASIPPYRRQFSMMFQEFALFPHKNVTENIAFGLRIQKLSEDVVAQRTTEMIELVGLQGMEYRDINDLSGGERQRVALARSLAPKPKLLMLDEPMGSLDRTLRERLILDLRQILKKVNATAIFVTHDQNEAFVLADRVAIFNKGFIEQQGIPENLFRNPGSEFVARFLGFQNLLPVTGNHDGSFQSAIGSVNLPETHAVPGSSLTLLIRPEAARIVTNHPSHPDHELEIACRVIDCRFQGALYQLQVVTAITNIMLVFHLPSASPPPQPKDPLRLALKTTAMTLI